MGWCLFSGRVFVNVQPDAAGVQQGVATLQSAASQQQKNVRYLSLFRCLNTRVRLKVFPLIV